MKATMVPPRTPMQVSAEDFPKRIRVDFDPEGTLLLSARFGEWICRITPWPQLSCQVRYAGFRRWQPVDHGMVDLRSLLHVADKARQAAGGQLAMFQDHPVHRRNWAPLWPRFAASIPSHLRSLIHQCPEGHWQLLQLIGRLGTAAEDYLEAGDHALLFVLANAKRFVGHAVSMEDIPRLCGQPRHKVLGCLGFPGTPSTANLFRKVRLSACTVEDLLLLRDQMTGPSWASDSTLHHLPAINFLTLYIWLSPTFRHLCDASFLHEISRMDDEELKDAQATLLAVDFMAEEDELWDDVTSFQSVSQLLRCWEELYRDREDIDMGRKFPPPPVHSARGRDPWRPLCSAQELRREAEYMGHCAERYISPVAKGRCYVYALEGPKAPDRATALLRRDRQGQWQLAEVRSRWNQPVTPETVTLAESLAEAARQVETPGLAGTPVSQEAMA